MLWTLHTINIQIKYSSAGINISKTVKMLRKEIRSLIENNTRLKKNNQNLINQVFSLNGDTKQD